MAINTYFKNIADAIRTKTGGSGLITPANMPDEILGIKSGAEIIEPLHIFNEGYVNGSGTFTIAPNISRCNIYKLEENALYVICKKNASRGNGIAMFENDIYGTTVDVSGGSVIRYNGGEESNTSMTVNVTYLPTRKYLLVSSFVYSGRVNTSDYALLKFNDLFEG